MNPLIERLLGWIKVCLESDIRRTSKSTIFREKTPQFFNQRIAVLHSAVQLRHQALSACPPRHLPLGPTIRRVWHAWQPIQLQLHSIRGLKDLRGKPWKVKGGTTMIHSKSWSMWNANLGFELLEIWWILQVPSPRRTSYPQVEVMGRKGLISLWNEPSSRVRNSGKTSVPSKFAFTGCTTVVQKHWTYVNIKVIQSSEFFLNLVVCATIGPILWLMDPWISMKLRSPVHPPISILSIGVES